VPPPVGLSPALLAGVALHRSIDSFADRHPAFRRSRARISPARRRVGGIMVDLFYDHFLALHWSRLRGLAGLEIDLAAFTSGTYTLIAAYGEGLPPGFMPVFARISCRCSRAWPRTTGWRATVIRIAWRWRWTGWPSIGCGGRTRWPAEPAGRGGGGVAARLCRFRGRLPGLSARCARMGRDGACGAVNHALGRARSAVADDGHRCWARGAGTMASTHRPWAAPARHLKPET